MLVVAFSLILLGATAPETAPAAADTEGEAPANKSPFSKKPRRAQPRSAVPEEVIPLLPWQGLYASGGGAASPAWRVVITAEGDLRAGTNPKVGSSSTALVDKKRRKLDPAILTELIKLADRAWREKSRPAEANPDYGELLVVADGAAVFVLDPGGPLPGGAAQMLIRRLQAEAAK